MFLRRARVGLILGCWAVGCAHAPPQAAVKAQPAAPAPPNPFELTVEFKAEAIQAPAGFLLRIKSPTATLPRALKLSGDPTLRGFSDPRALAGLALGGELATLIDFDAPMDVLFEPGSASGTSLVGVARVADEARFAPSKLGSELRAVSPGRWQIRPSDGGEKVQCELWHVAAPVGFRILCGQDAADIARTAPFLLEQLEKQPLLADARFELPRALLTPQQAQPNAEDSGVQELNRALGKRWGAHADTIAVNLKWLEQDVELGIEVDFAAADTSAAFQGWLGGAKAALPRQLFQVLDSSPIALGFAGTDDAMMKQLLSDSEGPFLEFLKDVNQGEGITPELAERMTRAAGSFIPERCRFTLSLGGPLAPLLPKKQLRPPSRSQPAKNAGSTWLLAGLAGPGARYQAALDVLFEESRYVRLAKPTDLPPESILFRGGSAQSGTWFAWVLPTPEWVWLLGAVSQRDLLAQARRLLPSLRERETPSGAEPAEFGAEPPLLALSFSLAALKETFGDLMADHDVAALPFGGSTRVFARMTGKRVAGGPRPLLALDLWTRWSPAAITDLVELIRAYANRPSGAALDMH